MKLFHPHKHQKKELINRIDPSLLMHIKPLAKNEKKTGWRYWVGLVTGSLCGAIYKNLGLGEERKYGN